MLPLKAIIGSVLILLVLVKFRSTRLKFENPELLIIFGFFVLYMGVSIFWSDNPAFGFRKWINLIVTNAPVIFALLYLYNSSEFKRYAEIFLFSLLFYGLVSMIIVAIFFPFKLIYGQLYSFEFDRWSHVIYGRLIGTVFLVFLFYLIIRNDRKKFLWGIPVILFFSYGIFITGLRSSVFGFVLILISILAYLALKKQLNIFNSMSVVFPLLLILLCVFFAKHRDDIMYEKFERILSMNISEMNKETSFNARYKAVSTSVEGF